MARGERFTKRRVEQRAESLLGDFLRSDPTTAIPPVPVELIADFLDLAILWEPIPEPDNEIVFAKLKPIDRQILFNETQRDMFETNPFLYEVTLAHEIGHWDLHMERGTLIQDQSLPGFPDQEFIVYRRLRSQNDKEYWDERNAKRYAGCLLLPQRDLCTTVAENPIRGFPDIYRLRDRFQVTVSTLNIRLQELELCYIDSEGIVHRSRQEYAGQMSLL